jgi:major membrane immunogen (membrane-anchored lipoprotein)
MRLNLITIDTMRFSSKIGLLIFLAVLLLTFACSNSENTNQTNANQTTETNANAAVTTKDDAAELAKIVNLPVMFDDAEVEEVVWREESVGGQPDAGKRRLVAVFFYTPENSKKLVEIIEKHKPAEEVEIQAESWFPAELVAQGQTSGNDTIKGAAYSASDFTKPPFENGRITRVSATDYFVLELSTK